MRLAREKVDIRSLGIKELRPCKTRTGALLLALKGRRKRTPWQGSY